MGEDYIIDMRHISKTYPGVKALDGVELKIRKGEVHSLVGENGAGKSTLIKLLAGVEMPDEGAEIFIDGTPAQIRTPLDAIRLGISVIYQDISLFPNISIAENICVGQDGGGLMRWRKVYRDAQDCLEEFNIHMDVRQMLGSIDIARQQIVAIARAIYSKARMIIMDEPTASLSTSEIQVLYKIIGELKKKGISILFVSHKFDEIFTVSDRITILRDGRYVDCRDISGLTHAKLIKLMVGRDVAVIPQQRDIATDRTVFEVRNLTKAGNFDDISFSLRQGEVLGITGLVGAGRTELARAIYGIAPADSGEIILEGRPLKIRSAPGALAHGISYLPEDRRSQGIIKGQTMSNNITIAALKDMRNRAGMLVAKKEAEKTEEMIRVLDIRPNMPEIIVDKLSGGNQQKVVFAKWLATDPKVLIVDEPTVGIDVGAKIEIHKLLWDLAEKGIGIIMISSELPEVLAVCSRVMIMAHGRVTGSFDNMEEVTQEKMMERALDTAARPV